MKKIAVLAFSILFAVASVSFAADNESWIQKMKNKFQKKEVAVPIKAAPAKEVAVPIKADPAKEVNSAEAPKKKRKDMTKNELASDIANNLNREGSILNMVPGLEKSSDSEGKDYYTYQGTKLEDLDKSTLDGIFGRVRNEALRLRTDRITRQMETVRRASAATSMIPQVPRASPTVNTPPQIPRPAQPPSRPSTPPAPPASPRR